MTTIAAFPQRLRLPLQNAFVTRSFGSPNNQHGTTLLLSVLVTLLFCTLTTAARAQREAKPIAAAKPAPAAQPSPTPTPTCTPPQSIPPPADGDLKFVVAVFRHGVRSPLKTFDDESAGKHSGRSWPSLDDWTDKDKCASWGDLTPHGATAVTLLGAWYGRYYSKALGKSFKAYFWADIDERTQKTAAALATGFGTSGVSAQVESLSPPETVDPLFHPFQAVCGTPAKKDLDKIVQNIKGGIPDWLSSSREPLGKLYDVLACQTESGNKTPTPSPTRSPSASPCEPLRSVPEKVSAWGSPTPTPGAPPPPPTPSPRPSSPITWDGQFSYASSATEAFLLEYANNMPPGWGQVGVGQKGPVAQLSDLLRLHEFYFDITERDPYLASIQGANLLREILNQLNRKADGKPLDVQCPHGDGNSDFVGLVGHDTNLANLNALLDITWRFNDPRLPADTLNLPDNDALPAGALVFELRGSSPKDYRVRIQYVTQSLRDIRNAPQPGDAYRLQTSCGDNCSQCEIPLEKFRDIAEKIINNNSLFLSHCKGGKQTCR